MAYQGSGINGADGLGLRLKVPKRIKRGIKKLGRGLKKVVRSPVFKGAVIGAAGGYIYGRVRKAQKSRARQASIDRANAALDRLGPPKIAVTPGGIPVPSPVPYIEPPNIPTGRPPYTEEGPGPALDKARIAQKIMAAIPLTPEEMALVRSGALGQGMLAAAEAAYGSDMYQPGAGQPLPEVVTTAERTDNTMLYAGLGLVGLLLLTQNKRG